MYDSASASSGLVAQLVAKRMMLCVSSYCSQTEKSTRSASSLRCCSLTMQKLWFVFILAYVLISTQQLSILWQMMTAHVVGA